MSIGVQSSRGALFSTFRRYEVACRAHERAMRAFGGVSCSGDLRQWKGGAEAAAG